MAKYGFYESLLLSQTPFSKTMGVGIGHLTHAPISQDTPHTPQRANVAVDGADLSLQTHTPCG